MTGAALSAASTLLLAPHAHASPTLTVSSASEVSDGQRVTVTVSGFSDGLGAITECNNASGQPTVALGTKQVPVSCTNPTAGAEDVVDGAFVGKPFAIRSGTIGPPATVQDSSGKDAAADAAQYPCPPTPAQASAGATCVVVFTDAIGQQASQAITFKANPISPAIGIPTGFPTNPGPTNAAVGAVPPAVATPVSVLGTQFQRPTDAATTAAEQQSTGTLPRTGPNDYLAPLALTGFVILDLGYLFKSSTTAPRPRRRREGVVPRA